MFYLSMHIKILSSNYVKHSKNIYTTSWRLPGFTETQLHRHTDPCVMKISVVILISSTIPRTPKEDILPDYFIRHYFLEDAMQNKNGVKRSCLRCKINGNRVNVTFDREIWRFVKKLGNTERNRVSWQA